MTDKHVDKDKYILGLKKDVRELKDRVKTLSKLLLRVESINDECYYSCPFCFKVQSSFGVDYSPMHKEDCVAFSADGKVRDERPRT